MFDDDDIEKPAFQGHKTGGNVYTEADTVPNNAAIDRNWGNRDSIKRGTKQDRGKLESRKSATEQGSTDFITPRNTSVRGARGFSIELEDNNKEPVILIIKFDLA